MRFERTFRQVAAIGVVVLLAACTGEGGQADDGEFAAERSELESRVAELEEEREQLIDQRDVLQEELDEVRAAEDAAEADVEAGVADTGEAGDDGADVEVVGLGETVRFDDWKFTVTEARTETSIDRADPPRGVYRVLTLEVENDGTQPRSFLGGPRKSAFLVDPGTGREYEFDSRASLDYHQSVQSGTWHLDDIGPGLADTLPLVFDTPEDSGPLLVFAVVSGEQLSSGVTVAP